MHRSKTALFAGLLSLGLGGCVISVNDGVDWGDEDDWRARQSRNLEAINHLQLGRSVGSVIGELGEPDLTESFRRDGLDFRVLLYRTRVVRQDGRTTRDETTPLVFVDDALVGWGDSAVAHALP